MNGFGATRLSRRHVLRAAGAAVTLPLLEGVRRLARWSGDADGAIAAATVLPRRLIGEGEGCASQLLGQPLGETLRWSGPAADLRWRRAA